MRSATDFLPSYIRLFMNLDRTRSPNFGVGVDFAFFCAVTTGHLMCSLLRTLGAVLRTALLTVLDALGIEHTTDDVIAHTGKVLHTAAADHHHRVLLKVVAFTRDVADDLKAVGQTDLATFRRAEFGFFGVVV
jgi:hypothetical protein